ncbi:ABC transporter G family member 21-like [Nicotiana tomentosiformis]|uniref:ABC transporter G family member 21-like n=1 Tax=Nicotiana tomentosiformis TaxID=4098 RepID=UPI00051C9185|nr:ABC transporter G family member 21-like [Nicotiana tomentosiformis]
MLPHDQDNNINSGSSNILVRTRIENMSLQIEPTGNVSPRVNDEVLDLQQQSNHAKLSVLRESLRPVTLKFEDVSYTIKLERNKGGCFSSTQQKQTRMLLQGVTGIVKPGEILAMLGPSGCGKTTLLTALSGRLPGKFSGTITYNGQQFSSSMKRKIGFVTQDDVLYPHLTVLETLTYAALLRLPNKLTNQEKIEQAELVIMELGLTRCKNSMIGGQLFRGISGGERKRVSIGQEMLVNPSLLLLDEPTSGLDSTTAQRIVATLRWLARGGRTVITTIHQPSSRLFRMFDKIIVLTEGCPIYSGKSSHVMEYFTSIGYAPGFNFMNPADFLLDLANGITPDTRHDDQHELLVKPDQSDNQNATKQSLITSYRKNIHPSLKEDLNQSSKHSIHTGGGRSPSRSPEDQWTTSWWLQFKVLLGRGLKERKHEAYSGLRIFQVMSVAFLSGLLWWHCDTNHIMDQVGLLFFFSIFWGFFPLFNAIFAFPQERPMLIRERSSGMYRLSSYYFARTVGDLPMELVLPTIFVTVTYWMGGLKPSFLTFMLTLLIILLNVLVSQGLGLALGAILMDVKQATTLSSVLMLVFLLASGYYIQHIPIFINWLKYISFSHYCYKLLLGVQYSKNELYECGIGKYCEVMEFPAIKVLGIDNLVLDVVALVVMLVVYRLLAYVALRLWHQ